MCSFILSPQSTKRTNCWRKNHYFYQNTDSSASVGSFIQRRPLSCPRYLCSQFTLAACQTPCQETDVLTSPTCDIQVWRRRGQSCMMPHTQLGNFTMMTTGLSWKPGARLNRMKASASTKERRGTFLTLHEAN